MSENEVQQHRHAWPAALVGMAVLVAMYVAGYFVLGDYYLASARIHERAFPSDIVTRAYYPMGWLERLRGELVHLDAPNNDWSSFH